MAPREERIEAWSRLARDLDVSKLERMTREIGLGEVVDTAAALLDGKERGRIVVDVNR
jgi:acrylyl-CoA reductase (NADPH)